jgi:hypothetical protein
MFLVADVLACVTENLRIFGHDDDPFKFGPEDKVNCRALASLACLSRTFKEPAITVLWKILPNFLPLVRLLPGNMVYWDEELKAYNVTKDVAVSSFFDRCLRQF